MDWAAVEVGDEHAAALRAFVDGDIEAWESLHDRMTTDETAAGYMSMIYARFAVAVRHRFSPTYTTPEIVRWVADMRIALEEDGEQLNPQVTENLIRSVLGDPDLRIGDELEDPYAVIPAECAVLSKLAAELVTSETELEKFIRDSAEFAKQWVAAKQSQAREEATSGSTTRNADA
ncbi:hypothetical protein BZB76_4427 [Actinomadura pelletieri DSM 43383]|uniref:Uncharacterized protein n=1 Tax=Actinomadura pelletieri DSM 43383 TaxID=1120940 RepID=A0A495QMA2_9ACTN|nr:hypothetical protein [Actinomadura pelletieri]RKS73724.1 hypothetical protein BZB76_4427 [Actinomadura pelletieri DSM 43383]